MRSKHSPFLPPFFAPQLTAFAVALACSSTPSTEDSSPAAETGGASSGGATAEPGSGGRGSGGGGEVTVCETASTLKAAAACSGKLVGAALSRSHLGEAAYVTAAQEHNYATAENEMKWESLEPQRDQFNFDAGDQIVDFSTDNGMKVKGHVLVWHSQLPGWVSSLTSEEEVRSAMLNHIQKVMEHYKGKVVAWDVVNEAVDTDNKQGDGNARLRDSVFYQYLGEGFIDEAFQAARAVDPNVKLFYNDYSTEGMNDKSDKVYEIVKSMVERGIPIDGVGIQTHIGKPNDNPPVAEIITNMQRIAELGLEIQISELDINGCDGIPEAEREQKYYDIVAACVAQPNCTAVTMWGITDKYSWLNSFGEAGCSGQSAGALLWDDNYQKKGAYDAVIRAFTGN